MCFYFDHDIFTEENTQNTRNIENAK